MQKFLNNIHIGCLTVIALFIFGFILLQTVFHGFDQRIEWGIKPPYHWSASTYNSDTWHEYYYTGVNGKECAVIYEDSGEWHVYGYGFFAQYATEKEAQNLAYRRCY